VGVEVRPAHPADADGICRAHQGSVETWFRYPQEGPPLPVAREELDEAGLWLNGGPWMVPSLCRAHLTWLLAGAGFAWVGLLDGEITGEVETYLSAEPPPLGRYTDLSVLYVHRDAQHRGVGSALVEAALGRAAQEGCDTVLIGGGADAPAFYARFGFSPWRNMVLCRVACPHAEGAGQPIKPGDYSQVAGLPVPVGRYPSARQCWEHARGPALLPAALACRWRQDWRVLQAAAEPVWAAFSADVLEPGRVTVHAWSLARLEELVPLLLAEAGALGYSQADMLLEEDALLELRDRHGLAEARRHQAWWRPLQRAS
jgi:GNAT superfamily N-acetyltransferase